MRRPAQREVVSRLACRRAGAALAAMVVSLIWTASTLASPAATLRVGTQILSRCGGSLTAYCGRLSVPLDYAAPSGPHISIGYRFYPASEPSGAHAAGTVVPVEGGPGYPSIGSVSYASGPETRGYATMYGALLEHWNMLAVDNRGTGESTPLSCPALQTFKGETDGEAFQQTAASCAEALNHRWRSANGSWVTPRTCSPRPRRRRTWQP